MSNSSLSVNVEDRLRRLAARVGMSAETLDGEDLATAVLDAVQIRLRRDESTIGALGLRVLRLAGELDDATRAAR